CRWLKSVSMGVKTRGRDSKCAIAALFGVGDLCVRAIECILSVPATPTGTRSASLIAIRVTDLFQQDSTEFLCHEHFCFFHRLHGAATDVRCYQKAIVLVRIGNQWLTLHHVLLLVPYTDQGCRATPA